VINPNDIRSALEQQFNAFNAANPVTIDGVYDDEEMDVVRENTAYMPQIGRPYQRTHLLPADTQQPEKGGNGVTLESGIFQIDLNYPVGGGAGDAAARAQANERHLFQWCDRAGARSAKHQTSVNR
jgi:hypothetical protein